MLLGWYFSENQMESSIVNQFILQKCFYQNELPVMLNYIYLY